MKIQKILLLLLVFFATSNAIVEKPRQKNSSGKKRAVLEHSLKAGRSGTVVKISTAKLLYQQELRRQLREKNPTQRA